MRPWSGWCLGVGWALDHVVAGVLEVELGAVLVLGLE